MKLMHVTFQPNGSVVHTACRLDRNMRTGEEAFFCDLCGKQIIPADDDPIHIKEHPHWTAPRPASTYL